MSKQSRRAFLRNAALGTAGLGMANLFGFSRAFAQNGGDDDVQTVLNLAATAELFASTHYLAAINGDLGLSEVQNNYLKAAFISERDHYDLLLSLGAEPVVTEFFVPDGLFADVAMFSEITEVAETTFTAAYLAATRIFANLGETAFAVTAAQISGVEAEHRALVRQIGMRLPNDRTYQSFEFANVSGAVPILQPFLDGSGDGFVGPVQPPSDDEVAAIRSEADALGYMTSVLPFAAMDMTEMSSGGETVTVMTLGAVNVRTEPTTDSTVMRTLPPNTSVAINGQRSNNGFVWWRLADGGWVREDTVSEPNGAMDLPAV